MGEPARIADQPVKQHGSRNDEEIGTHCLQTTDAKQPLHIQILFEMRGQLVIRIVLNGRFPLGQPFFAPDSIEEGAAEGVVGEQPVQVGAADPPVPGDGAVKHLDIRPRPVDDMGKRLHRAAENGFAHVNLVALQLLWRCAAQPGSRRRGVRPLPGGSLCGAAAA